MVLWLGISAIILGVFEYWHKAITMSEEDVAGAIPAKTAQHHCHFPPFSHIFLQFPNDPMVTRDLMPNGDPIFERAQKSSKPLKYSFKLV